jgi:hypothetical protein
MVAAELWVAVVAVVAEAVGTAMKKMEEEEIQTQENLRQ